MSTSQFASLGIGASLCRALAEIGYEQPTAIQQQALPEILAGRDLLGIAQTGTGKTAAFALPLLEQLVAGRVRARARCPAVLILAPTRELAAQIQSEIARFACHTRLRHACVFGGVGLNPQIKALAKGVDLLVATPGRLLDLSAGRHVDLSNVAHLVLDEADRLLDMGFIRDVRKIVQRLPAARQSLLFTATMPAEVVKFAGELLNDPARVNVAPRAVTVELIDQAVAMVPNEHKQAVLQKLLNDPAVRRCIVFTRTKHGANRVAKKLERVGIGVEAIHGNKSQNARTRALERFKSGDVWVLVATDVAARGIDIDGVTHIINFELPHEPESYVHRIGRTARAGASGVAWSLVDPAERKRLKAIERLTKVQPARLEVDVPEGAQPEGADQPERRDTQRSGAPKSGDGDKGARRRRRRPRRRRAA